MLSLLAIDCNSFGIPRMSAGRDPTPVDACVEATEAFVRSSYILVAKPSINADIFSKCPRKSSSVVDILCWHSIFERRR